MSVTTAKNSVPLGAITTFRLVNTVENAIVSVQTWIAARKSYNALVNLSDGQLDDIGLTRANFRDAVSNIHGVRF